MCCSLRFEVLLCAFLILVGLLNLLRAYGAFGPRSNQAFGRDLFVGYFFVIVAVVCGLLLGAFF